MNLSEFGIIAVALVALTSMILSVGRDWRLGVSALGVQYVGVFVLILESWPLEMAIVKLVAGWIAASVLGLAMVGTVQESTPDRTPWISETAFRFFPAGLVALTVYSLAPNVRLWFVSASREQILGGLVLICMGILHLGLTAQSWRTIFGLLTVFSGFEILYATVETSVLVAGFLAVVTMGVSLAGAYLQVAPEMEVEA